MSEVAVAELHDLGEQRAASELFLAVWKRADGNAPLAPELIRAIGHAGGYVGGAWVDGKLVGASVGFLGLDENGVILHSHITGIHPDAQGQGIGGALKRHQRAWANDRDIVAITWTFDPLVRRNGHFNLQTLGATAIAYLPDFYGVMADALNGGDPTDRCFVHWDVRHPRTTDEPDVAALLAAGAETTLAPDKNGWPDARPTAGAMRLCWVPDDIVDLRANDAPAAAAWRLAVRNAMGAAMAAGLIGTGMSRDGWYVLTEPGTAA